MVQRALAPILASAGFQRQRTTWNRLSGDFLDVVNVQFSSARDRVWINLGVVHPATHEAVWGEPLTGFVDEASCTVRTRLGHLIHGFDRSWDVTEPDAGDDVASAMRVHGLTFLERMHSLDAMESMLSAEPFVPPEVFYLAVIRWRLGKHEGACEALADYRSRALGDWAEKVDELAREIGCT